VTYDFPKPCLRCGVLFRGRGGLCPTHNAEYLARQNTPEKKAKKQALYGGDYRKRRKAVVANATHCHICKLPFQAGDQIEADHLVPLPNSPLLAAHRHCNQAKGDKTQW
jgi:hypothetical protein